MLGSLIFLGGSAVYALYWAASHGQFKKMDQGAKIIFDSGEPVGKVTDQFPGVDMKKKEEQRLAKRKMKKA